MSLDNYIDAYREGLREVRKLKAEDGDKRIGRSARIKHKSLILAQDERWRRA